MSIAHVDNDTPKATADDVKTRFKDTPAGNRTAATRGVGSSPLPADPQHADAPQERRRPGAPAPVTGAPARLTADRPTGVRPAAQSPRVRPAVASLAADIATPSAAGLQQLPVPAATTCRRWTELSMQHAGISPNSAAAQQIHHAEHQHAIAGRTETRLRTARSVIAHQRDLIEEKAAKLTPDPEVRKVTATAIRCLLAPYTADDAHTGTSTRRFLLSAAAITTVLTAVAVLRNR